MNTDPVVTFFTALFCEPGAVEQAASVIAPEDFSQADYRSAYRAIIDLNQSGKPVDVAHVYDKLLERGMTDIQATELIERLMDGEPIIDGIRHYAELIHKNFRRQRLKNVTEVALQRANGSLDPGEVIRDLQADLLVMQSEQAEHSAAGPSPATKFMLEFLDDAVAERARNAELAGFSTGIQILDDVTTGIRPGELWIVGALPGRGKTAFGSQVALHAALRDVPVMFFSLEMTRVELARRILGTEFGVWQMRTLRNMPEMIWHTLRERAAALGSTIPLLVDDASSLTATEVAAHARTAIRERGVRLTVVDYLQLLRGPEREIRERVGNAANLMRQLAKDTQVPVVLLSQLRRPQDVNTRPTMIDLKESGDIEAHASTALLLYSPLGQDQRPTGDDEIIIGKQRNGPIGSVPVYFDTRTLVFRQRDTTQRTPMEVRERGSSD